MLSTNPFTRVVPDASEKDLINWYLNYSISNFKQDFKNDSMLAKKLAYDKFNHALSSVPAYKQFLQQKGWTKKSNTYSEQEWDSIPLMDKSNYISKYPLNELVSNNTNSGIGKIISLSSGSSGTASYWPRGPWQEIEGALLHEQLLTNCFEIDKQSTLVVVAFTMGSYLAGTYTFNSVRWVGSKKYNLSVISPGIASQDGINMISKLAPYYDQIVLAGYPPFIKDLLEEGVNNGIKWQNWRIKLLMASEFFSEKWREGIGKLAGIKDVVKDTTNIFGASEGTLFGWESQEAIIIRQEASKNKELNMALFGSNLMPTLVEYNEALRYFEVIDGRLILTALGGVPLIRYDLKDNGGILSVEKRRKILLDYGIDITKRISSKSLSNNPMVYVLGRADQASSIYGVLIYPEYVKFAIEDEVNRLTGKFTMLTAGIGEGNAELNIHLELKKGKKRTEEYVRYLEEKIRLTLIGKSHEYMTLENSVSVKCWPKVYLHSNGDPSYFGSRIKQKWTDH